MNGEKGQAQKRGGGKPVLSLDFESAESRFDIQPLGSTTAECLFHRQWALTLLERVQTRLRQEMESRGNEELYASLQPRLVDDPGAQKLADIGVQLEMTLPAVKMAMSRFRKRYRELLREEIAQTVSDEEEVDDEIRQLFEALRSGNS